MDASNNSLAARQSAISPNPSAAAIAPDILSKSAQEYELMLASIHAYRELAASNSSDNRAALNVALNAAYDNIGKPGYDNQRASLYAVIDRIEHRRDDNLTEKEKKRREQLHRHAFSEKAHELVQDTREARSAALYRQLDEDAKRRVAILSQEIDVTNRNEIENYARAIVESTALETQSEAEKAVQEITIQRQTEMLENDPTILQVHNAVSKQAREEAALVTETQSRVLKAASQTEADPERRALLQQSLDRGTAVVLVAGVDLGDAQLEQAPSNAVLQQALDTQTDQICDENNAQRIFAQLSPLERQLLNDDPNNMRALLSRRDEIMRLMEDNLGRKQQVFEAAAMLAKGENASVYSQEILRDAAAINATSLAISDNIVQNMTARALERDPRYREAYEARDVNMMRALLKENNPQLANAPNDRLDVVIHSSFHTIEKYEREAGKRLDQASKAESNEVTSKMAIGAVEGVRKEIQQSAEQIQASGDDKQSAQARNDRRHEEGVSFLELEYEDVIDMINEYDPKLVKRLGGADGRLDAAEAIRILEEIGVISEWEGENRQDSGTGRYLAAAGKLVDNDWTRFGNWNNENLARLNIERSGDDKEQLGGQEAWDALRLADYVKQNSDVMTAIDDQQHAVTYQQKHDINQDGKLDEMEIARVLMNAGVSDIESVDSAAELQQVLQDTRSAKEILDAGKTR